MTSLEYGIIENLQFPYGDGINTDTSQKSKYNKIISNRNSLSRTLLFDKLVNEMSNGKIDSMFSQNRL